MADRLIRVVLITLLLIQGLDIIDAKSSAANGSLTHSAFPKRVVLPNGPTLLNFPDINFFNTASTGVLDMWRLAFQGLQATFQNPPPSSYNRYFQPQDLCDVRKVLRAVLGEPGSIGPAMMNGHLTIAFDRSTWSDVDDYCASDPREMSYIVQQGDMAQIILCERAFRRPWLSLDQADCGMVGTSASEKSMDTIGSHILHELIHWKAIIDVKLGFHVGDWNPDEIEGDDHMPPDGYDPYNAWRLNLRDKSPGQNADSYVWFAIESWYAVKCSRLNGFSNPSPETRL